MKRALLTLAALAALTGCMVERPYVSPPDGSDGQDPIAPGATNLSATDGRVFGDIGAVRNFDAPVDQVDAWFNPDWQSTSITLTANDPQGRMGMVILDIDGVDLRNVRPGTYTYTTQSVDASLDGGYVNVTGCSSSVDSYYDEPGQQGTITVQDTNAGRKITVDSELPMVDGDGAFTTSTSVAHGSFTLE